MSTGEPARSEVPAFYYDLSSPYAYLASLRVDDVLPVTPRWVPIVFGVLLREIRRTPWSLREGEREAGQDEVASRARERGLPEMRWPQGWPAESYSVLPLRALVWTQQQDANQAKALTRALYEIVFAQGRPLGEIATVREAAQASGLDAGALEAGLEREEVKAALRANTAEALARGVTGIPTVAVGDALFWGDDRLEEAAAAFG